MSNKKVSVKKITTLGLVTALMCVLAPISIPTGIVPISLGSFVVYLTVYLVGLQYAVISNILYIVIGAIGLPVFSGYQGGLAKLTGPTGGYIIGFIFVSIIAGLSLKIFKGNMVAFGVGLVLGTAVLYMFGTVWFMTVMKMGLSKSLSLCVYPFIPFDLAKMVIVMIIGPMIRKPIKRIGAVGEW